MNNACAGCYHEINAESGVIESPGYPNPPPRHTYLFCSWIITVPEGRRVSLKITDFDLEPKGVNYWNEFKVSVSYLTTYPLLSESLSIVLEISTKLSRSHFTL